MTAPRIDPPDASRLGLRHHATEIGGAAVERQLDQRNLVPAETLFETGNGVLAEIVVLKDRRNFGVLEILEDIVGEHHHLHPYFRKRGEDVPI